MRNARPHLRSCHVTMYYYYFFCSLFKEKNSKAAASIKNRRQRGRSEMEAACMQPDRYRQSRARLCDRRIYERYRLYGDGRLYGAEEHTRRRLTAYSTPPPLPPLHIVRGYTTSVNNVGGWRTAYETSVDRCRAFVITGRPKTHHTHTAVRPPTSRPRLRRKNPAAFFNPAHCRQRLWSVVKYGVRVS